jgi:hypothetical protein
MNGDAVMLDTANTIHSYRLTTIRSAAGRLNEAAYGVRMLGGPRPGRPMVMYDSDGNRRIVTSPVVRIFGANESSGTYVQTRNTLYFLESK